jgi:hypothetical protein
MRKRVMFAAAVALVPLTSTVTAKKAPKSVWQVSRTSDPITGVTSCIVAAYDRVAGMSFSRSGALYPFVQNSSDHGVLVGVSSGGRIRLPTGDIVWRVDAQPFRTLRAADNPPGTASSAAPQANPAMQQLVEEQLRMIAAATATSTVASGATAKAMLSEMLAGSGLVFRSAHVTASYGLPSGAEREVGQFTRDGLRPYPLDASLRAGLTACGIVATAS